MILFLIGYLNNNYIFKWEEVTSQLKPIPRDTPLTLIVCFNKIIGITPNLKINHKIIGMTLKLKKTLYCFQLDLHFFRHYICGLKLVLEIKDKVI